MGYSNEVSGQTPEEEQSQITWEVINPADLPQLLHDTLNETVIQHISAAGMFAELLGSDLPQHIEQRNKSTQQISSEITKAFEQLRNLQRLLKQDPSQPIPIDHKYESARGNRIIALAHTTHPEK